METGYFTLRGSLDFRSVPVVWPLLQRKISEYRQLRVSLEHVEQANSAALALLLEGLDSARQQGCQLSFTHIPDELWALAEVSNVANLLRQ